MASAELGQRLTIAAAAGNKDAVDKLILKEMVDVNACDADGVTALSAAARAGKLKLIQHLLEISNPNLNATDTGGLTALDHAVEQGHDDIAEYMTLDTSLVPFARGLLPAIKRADLKVVHELIEHQDARIKADVNIKDSRGNPALHLAVRSESVEIVKVLLADPGLKINQLDRYSQTALDASIERDLHEIEVCIKKAGGKLGQDVDY